MKYGRGENTLSEKAYLDFQVGAKIKQNNCLKRFSRIRLLTYLVTYTGCLCSDTPCFFFHSFCC